MSLGDEKYDADLKNRILTVRDSAGIKHTIDASSAMESKSLDFFDEFELNIRHSNHIVGQVLYFIEKYAEIKNTDDDQKLNDFISEFVCQNQSRLVALLDAAYDLRVKSLWELMSKVVADMITGKTYEEIGKIFKLGNDITSEEMESRMDYASRLQ